MKAAILNPLPLLLLLIPTASATPISPRQSLTSLLGITATEFTTSGCRPIILLFARGSTEPGNLGTICGPPTGNLLKDRFGADNVAVEGIEYGARVATNFLPGGADPAGVREMERLIGEVAAQCPSSALVVGGYSQGAAVTHRAVEDLPEGQKKRIVAAVMFGDTQNEQVWAFPGIQNDAWDDGG